MQQINPVSVSIYSPNSDYAETLLLEIMEIYDKLKTLVQMEICIQTSSSDITIRNGKTIVNGNGKETVVKVTNPTPQDKGTSNLFIYLLNAISELQKKHVFRIEK